MMDSACVPHALKIVEIKIENARTKTFVLNGSLKADPGQFVMAWLPGHEDKPFSLADASPVSLTVAAVGSFTNMMHQLQVGDFIWVRGPFGSSFQLPAKMTPSKHILLIGGGYGVAPLLYLTKRALLAGHRVSMIIGARTSADLLLVETFKTLNVSLWLTTEDGSVGQQGLVTDAISRVMTDSQVKLNEIYACGPIKMLEAIADRCKSENINVQLAWEAHMRCGVGLCGSCELGQGWLTCLDGPVFPFDPVTTSPP